MSHFHPNLIKAVKEERIRIIYGGRSPNAAIWIQAAHEMLDHLCNKHTRRAK